MSVNDNKELMSHSTVFSTDSVVLIMRCLQRKSMLFKYYLIAAKL